MPALPGRAVLTVVRALRDDHGDAEVVEADPAAQQLVHRLQRDAGLRARCQPTAPPAPARAPPAAPGPAEPARPPALPRRRLTQGHLTFSGVRLAGHGASGSGSAMAAQHGPARPCPGPSPNPPRCRGAALPPAAAAGSWRPGAGGRARRGRGPAGRPLQTPRVGVGSVWAKNGHGALGRRSPAHGLTWGGVGPGWESPGGPPRAGRCDPAPVQAVCGHRHSTAVRHGHSVYTQRAPQNTA